MFCYCYYCDGSYIARFECRRLWALLTFDKASQLDRSGSGASSSCCSYCCRCCCACNFCCLLLLIAIAVSSIAQQEAQARCLIAGNKLARTTLKLSLFALLPPQLVARHIFCSVPCNTFTCNMSWLHAFLSRFFVFLIFTPLRQVIVVDVCRARTDKLSHLGHT